jgi:hypothetical protein
MRFRRIVVVLAALLALAFGSATATPGAGVFSTKTACVCVVVSDRDEAPVRPGRIEVAGARPGSPVLPVCLRAAWVDAAIRFQLPPPVRA